MYLVTAEGETGREQAARTTAFGGMRKLLVRGRGWWRARTLEQQRRAAKKRLFMVETMVLGPKQRVVLLRCGPEFFLVGTGAEGVTSVVRVQDAGATEQLPSIADGDEPWSA